GRGSRRLPLLGPGMGVTGGHEAPLRALRSPRDAGLPGHDPATRRGAEMGFQEFRQPHVEADGRGPALHRRPRRRAARARGATAPPGRPVVNSRSRRMTAPPPALAADDLVLCSGTLGERTSWLDKVDAAARAGFRGVSIYVHEYLAAVEAGTSASRLRQAVDERGLRVGEGDGPIRWLPAHARGRSDRPPLGDVEKCLRLASGL